MSGTDTKLLSGPIVGSAARPRAAALRAAALGPPQSAIRPEGLRMPSGSLAICTAPSPKRICGTHGFLVPSHASHVGIHDHQWNPEISSPGKTMARESRR